MAASPQSRHSAVGRAKNKRSKKKGRTKFRMNPPNPAEEHKSTIRNALGIVLLSIIFTVVGASAQIFSFLSRRGDRSASASFVAKNRPTRIHKTWKEEDERISNKIFFRLFRMTRPCFRKLCKKIEISVGREKFKSESYIQELKKMGHSTKKGSIHLASLSSTGEYIPGEMKLVITLRLLAGASYLDMFLWLNINPDYARFVAKEVMKNWICNDEVFEINYFKNVLSDKKMMTKIRLTYSKSSSGIIWGCIGCLDGWLVRIKCPSVRETANPGKYYSRKGFFAINVQAIVDKEKRILWRYIGEKGSSHDSSCFNESGLGKYLSRVSESLLAEGIYILGDSAYALKSFLLTPYDNAMPGSEEDSFNYYLSKNRIYVECAFGEIDRRWGIFWKPLQGDLADHIYIL